MGKYQNWLHLFVWLITAVTATLLNFVRLFRKAHEENVKQSELERKKAEKEAEMEKAKGINLTKKSVKFADGWVLSVSTWEI